MAKQITFEFEGKEYVLEFTRKSIETMEKQGFIASEIAEKPVSTLPTLFAGAFLAHHRYVKRDVIDKIFDKLTNKEELIGKLAEMYNEPIIALMDEPGEDEGKRELGSELVNSASFLTYTEQFYNQFPFYLSIGMTYDQYWNDDCELVVYYRKANELKNARKNQELWLQGMYIYEALCCVSPVLHAFAKSGTKPHPYPDKPYAISAKEIKEHKETIEKENRKKAMAVFMAWASQLDVPDNVEREEVNADVHHD